MSDPHWTSYVGMAAGIVGAITGISGAILGLKSYRKANEIKSLDLRLELRKAINNANTSIDALVHLIPAANLAVERNLAARGLTGSSFKDNWVREYTIDEEKFRQICQKIGMYDHPIDDYSHEKLEMELSRIHQIQNVLDQMVDKYERVMRDGPT
ncbi:MAG: hypothetical protein AB2697_22600 [Candidatus Thiodiazotropha endolucinida]